MPHDGRVTPERLKQLAWGFAPPLILEVAIAHRLFDRLDERPQTADELSAATGASPRGLRILLNALVGLEFLEKRSDDAYALTAESAAFLVSTKPEFQGGTFKHVSRQLLQRWMQLGTVVDSGRPADAVNDEASGAAFFQEFVADIYPMSAPAAAELAAHLGVASSERPVSVLDLAAGSGVWGIALAKQSPQVRVTAVDWEGVLPATRRITDREGVADQFQLVAGDLDSADFGRNHDVATLGHILHSEGGQRSRSLLSKVFHALAPGGTIAIAEFLVNADRTGPLNSLIFAVNMLVHTEAGDTFSFEEISGWLKAAGFENPRTLDASGPSPLVLATKPTT